MLSLSFGYNHGTILLPYIAPGCCHYSTVEIRKTTVEPDTKRLDEFIQEKNTDNYIGIAIHLRVREFDTPEVINGIAYTCLGLVYEPKHKKYRYAWMTFHKNLKSLQRLRTFQEIPKELVDYLERKLWENMGHLRPRLERIVDKLILHLSLTVAEKFYHPEYVWKTGKNKGKTTMNVLLERCDLPLIC
jgi:hypothetical protein